MSFVLRFRRKKRKEEEVKPSSRFEDSIKAKIRLNLLEERYAGIQSLKIENPNVKDEDDKELEASKVYRQLPIETQGFGEVGDSAKPSNQAVEGFQELLEMAVLDELEYGKDSEISKVNAALISGARFNINVRSMCSKHTNVNVVTIPPELFMPGWMSRASREESLAT